MAVKLPEVLTTNIFVTMTYIIKIQTAKLRYSTIAYSQETYIGVSKHNRQLKMAPTPKILNISETRKGTVKIPTTNLGFKTL